MNEDTVSGTLADPTLRFSTLAIGSKTYQLTYDFDAIARAEEMTDIPLLVGVNWSHIKVRQIRAMLFASLLKAQPDITLAEVTALIKAPNMARIERALVEAWVGSTPEATDESSSENPPKPEPSPAESAA